MPSLRAQDCRCMRRPCRGERKATKQDWGAPWGIETASDACLSLGARRCWDGAIKRALHFLPPGPEHFFEIVFHRLIYLRMARAGPRQLHREGAATADLTFHGHFAPQQFAQLFDDR